MKKRILNIVIIGVAIICLCSGCSTYDPDDGKCDVCGDKATFELNDEEYCNEHVGDAAAWYLNQ